MWIPQLGSSFRLDETATHWVVRDGLGAAVDRAAEFQGESPAYFVASWLVRVTLGSSEAAARLLSLVAMALATWLLYLLVKRLLDSETGLLAAAVFAASQGIAFASADARPYALTVASTVAAALFLVRWVDASSRRDAIGAVVMATLAIYFQYLSVVTLVAIFVFGSWAVRDRMRRLQLIAMGAVVAVLLIPAVPQIVSLSRRRNLLAVPFPVSLPDLARIVVPPLLVLSLFVGVLAARLRGRVSVESTDGAGRLFALACAWTLAAPLAFYAISEVGDTTLFDPRYFFVAIPGIAMVAALGIRRLAPPAVHRIVAVVLAALSVVAFASVTHSPDDWREAARIVNARVDDGTPVLLRTAFIESRRVSWLTDPAKRAYLLSPLSPYPMRGDITLVPYALDPSGRGYLDSTLGGIVPRAPRLIYVSLSPDDIGLWLRGRLEASGYTETSSARAGSISIVEFSKS